MPGNYSYANSIWQDRLGNGTTMKEAVEKEGRDVVLGKIQQHYKDRAIADAKNQFGVAIGYAKPKKEKQSYFESSNDLKTLAKGFEKGGQDEVEYNGVKFTRSGLSKKDFTISKKIVVPGDPVTEIVNGKEVIKLNSLGGKMYKSPSFKEDPKSKIKMYLYDSKTKQYNLNFRAWRALVDDNIIRSVPN